jgi:hypothetical protein
MYIDERPQLNLIAGARNKKNSIQHHTVPGVPVRANSGGLRLIWSNPTVTGALTEASGGRAFNAGRSQLFDVGSIPNTFFVPDGAIGSGRL